MMKKLMKLLYSKLKRDQKHSSLTGILNNTDVRVKPNEDPISKILQVFNITNGYLSPTTGNIMYMLIDSIEKGTLTTTDVKTIISRAIDVSNAKGLTTIVLKDQHNKVKEVHRKGNDSITFVYPLH